MRAALALTAALALFPAPTSAQLEAAAQAERDGDLIAAARAYHAAVRGGGLSAADAARAHARLGVLDRATGDQEEAWAHFAVALAIDPTLAPPVELPPDERTRFESLRGTPYAVEGRREGSALHLRVAGAPPIAHALRVAFGGREELVPLEGAAARVALPPETGEVLVVALDEFGNELARATLAAPPSLAVPPASVVLECPRGGDPCALPLACRPPTASCDAGGGDVGGIVGGIVGAVLGVAAAIVITVLAVDAYEASLWRVDRAGVR